MHSNPSAIDASELTPSLLTLCSIQPNCTLHDKINVYKKERTWIISM